MLHPANTVKKQGKHMRKSSAKLCQVWCGIVMKSQQCRAKLVITTGNIITQKLPHFEQLRKILKLLSFMNFTVMEIAYILKVISRPLKTHLFVSSMKKTHCKKSGPSHKRIEHPLNLKTVTEVNISWENYSQLKAFNSFSSLQPLYLN